MFLRVFFGVIVVLVFASASSAQVDIINVDALKARLANPSDTTFVVNMWATWCKPCVAELPYFERLSREMAANRYVKVLLVSVDAKKDRETKLEPFLSKRGITAEVVLLSPVGVDGVDSSWSGAIPATLFAKGPRRGFFEQEFTYDDLKRTLDDFLKSATKP